MLKKFCYARLVKLAVGSCQLVEHCWLKKLVILSLSLTLITFALQVDGWTTAKKNVKTLSSNKNMVRTERWRFWCRKLGSWFSWYHQNDIRGILRVDETGLYWCRHRRTVTLLTPQCCWDRLPEDWMTFLLACYVGGFEKFSPFVIWKSSEMPQSQVYQQQLWNMAAVCRATAAWWNVG